MLSPLLKEVPDLSHVEDEDEPTRGAGAVVCKVVLDVDVEDSEAPVEYGGRFTLRAGARTDEGTKRPNNEDSLLMLSERSLYVVADGMGGHAGGEIASKLAVEAISATFTRKSQPAPAIGAAQIPESALPLVQGFAAANEAIRAAAAQRPWLASMGTTAVAAHFDPDSGRVYVAHVGDSRCYRLRGGKLEQLTRDHTLAELGFRGPERNRLSRAVGTRGIVEVDMLVLEMRRGDVFLLCSDGLTKVLKDQTIIDVLDGMVDADEAAAELIRRALDGKARDNVTAVVIGVAEGKRASERPAVSTAERASKAASEPPAASTTSEAPPRRSHIPFQALTRASVRPGSR